MNVRACRCAVLALVSSCCAVSASIAAPIVHTSVPISNAADAIVNDSQHVVYVTTSTGDVQRYDLAGQSLLTPWAGIGVNLRSLDTTADGAFLYIADQSAGPTQGVIRKVNTATGAKTNLFYDLNGEGAGAYDIVRLNNGRMLFTANNQFSGASSAVRFINTSTDAITTRTGDAVERQTDLFRSGSGNRVFMTGGNTSAGNVRVYDAATDSYLVNTDLFIPLNGIAAALDTNGNLLAFESFNKPLSLVHASDLSLVDTFPDYRSGVGFNSGGLLYMADYATDLFRIYDPTTLSQIGSFASGIDLSSSNPGNIIFTADGGTMIYQTGSGLQVYQNVLVPEPASAAVAGVIALAALSGRRRK